MLGYSCCCEVTSVVSDSLWSHRRQPPGSPVPGILQARTLEWVAISFSNAWKWKVKGKSLSRVRLLVTPWTAAYQAPPSMGFSRWSTGVGCHCLLLNSCWHTSNSSFGVFFGTFCNLPHPQMFPICSWWGTDWISTFQFGFALCRTPLDKYWLSLVGLMLAYLCFPTVSRLPLDFDFWEMFSSNFLFFRFKKFSPNLKFLHALTLWSFFFGSILFYFMDEISSSSVFQVLFSSLYYACFIWSYFLLF